MHLVNGRGNEHRVAWPGSPDPVLGAPEFAGSLVRSPPAFEHALVQLPDEAKGQGEGLQSLEPVEEGVDVVGHLSHVVERDRLFELGAEEVG